MLVNQIIKQANVFIILLGTSLIWLTANMLNLYIKSSMSFAQSILISIPSLLRIFIAISGLTFLLVLISISDI